MESELLNIAGVAIMLLAEEDGSEPPLYAAACGRELVRRCIEAPVPGLGSVVESVVAAFWTGRSTDTRGGCCEAGQLTAIARLMQRHAPSPTALAAARSETCEQSGRCYAKAAVTARLVDSILSPALLDGSLDHAGLSIAGTRAILSDIFAAVLSNAGRIAEIAPAIRDAIRASLDARTSCGEIERWRDDATAEHASRLAADLGLPQAMIDGLIAAQRRFCSSDAAFAAPLDTTIVDAIETIDELRRLADNAGNDETFETVVLEAVAHIRAGRLAAADAGLAGLLPALEQTARTAAPGSREAARYTETLAARGRVCRLARKLREGAGMFQRAARAWLLEDRVGRWRLRLAQARMLTELGGMAGVRSSVLAEAIHIYAEAGGIVSERDCPLEWAEASIEVGALLLRLGNRECKPERYLAAALHFKPAVEVMTRERALDGWARGQVGLADALRGQGAFQGDVVTLGDAAFAYRAALGILTRGMTPELWLYARAALGETLVRMAEETGNRDMLEEALELLMQSRDGADQFSAGATRTMVDLALGRAMLLLTDLDAGDPTSDQVGVLGEALRLVERALEAPVAHLTALERAAAHRARGTIEALLAVELRAPRRLAAAVAAKKRAQELYLAFENEVEADHVAREIEDIEATATELDDGDSVAVAV